MFEHNKKFYLDETGHGRVEAKISTTFEENLEQGILDMLSKYKVAPLTEVTKRFGDYPQVHNKLKDLVLENKIFMYEKKVMVEDRLKVEKTVKIVDPNASSWNPFNAQPCLTCMIMSECKVGNPVSPATCQEFQEWLDFEIELEMSEE